MVNRWIMQWMVLAFCFSHAAFASDCDGSEFDLANVRKSLLLAGDIKDVTKEIERLEGMLNEDVLPVEEFVIRRRIAAQAQNIRQWDKALQNAERVVEIGDANRKCLKGALLVFYLENLRLQYEIPELRRDNEAACAAYKKMYDKFQENKSWKAGHEAEYLAVLVALYGKAESDEDRMKCLDAIITETPNAQTIPFWISQRYDREILGNTWEETSEILKAALKRYEEYPLTVLIYSLLGNGYKRHEQYESAIEMFEAGIAHTKKDFPQISESRRDYFLNGESVKGSMRVAFFSCAECYMHLGMWEQARQKYAEAIPTLTINHEGTKRHCEEMLEFIDNDPSVDKFKERWANRRRR